MNSKIPAALIGLLETMRKHPKNSPAGLLLSSFLPNGLDSDACTWLSEQTRRESLAVVFIFEMPGYVLAGLEGEARPYRDPNIDGLRIAHEVMISGINAPAVLRASDWAMTPNAMRNTLARAAEWADSRCPRLAVAIRAIRISKEGRPSFEPNHPIELRVF